ncbi:MAG TPA: c-type cytochrome [Polyangiales bacterium]|nr:c-type cytochrome [Polyangiales bacterium]
MTSPGFKLAACLLLALLGCGRSSAVSAHTGGDPERGERLIRGSGCAACHSVPGIRKPRGVVGPSLSGFASRAFIAGVVPNTPRNLVRWVMDPPAVAPGTAMPALGLNDAQAQDVAAYLYTLD